MGKKTAERLLVEMRDKAGKWLGELSPNVTAGVGAVANSDNTNDAREEAEQALVALGYKLTDASRLVASVDDGASTSENLIRRALQAAAPRSQR